MSEQCNYYFNTIEQMKNKLNNYRNLTDQQKIQFFSDYGITITQEQLNNINSDCANIIGIGSSNIIDIPEECNDLMNDICRDFIDDDNNYNICIQELRPRITNIRQENITRVHNNCEINNIISLLDNVQPSENRNMILVALQQLLNDNNNVYMNVDICNSIPNIISDAEFQKTHNECVNSNLIKNSNYLKTCHGNNIVQSNYIDGYQSCMINSGIVFPTEDDFEYRQSSEESASYDFIPLIIGIFSSSISLISFVIIVIIAIIVIYSRNR